MSFNYMNQNMNSPRFPSNDLLDTYHAFSSNSPPWQDSSTHFRGQNHYRRPYPTVSPRQHRSGDFSQHGRYSYDKRTGAVHRSSIHNKTFDQEQLFDNNQYQTTMINSINDNSNEFFRKNMLEDPWTNMKPQKVPPNGISLVDDSTNH